MADMLVLGATGRIGRALRQIWGHRRDILWHGRSQTVDRPGWIRWTPGENLPRLRSLVVLAGVTQGDEQALAENAAIARAAIDAAEQAGIARVFLASSTAVYGKTPPEGATEESPCAPMGAYGKAKLDMEIAARHTAREVRVTALRIGNVVGADLLGRRLNAGQQITLDRFADGAGPVRSYIAPSALAYVLNVLHLHSAPLPPVLNVACPQPVAMEDLLRLAEVPFDWTPAPETAAQRVVMNCGLLQTLVGIAPDRCSTAQMAQEWHGFRKVMA